MNNRLKTPGVTFVQKPSAPFLNAAPCKESVFQIISNDNTDFLTIKIDKIVII